MTNEKKNTHQRPEGRLIETAMMRAAPPLKTPAAAKLANLSPDWFRAVVNGYRTVRAGEYAGVVAEPDALAKIAHALGITPDELRDADRPDAADLLERLTNPLTRERVAAVADFVADLLNPDLADYSDADLLGELEGRMLLLAARLQATGNLEALSWRIDEDGVAEIVSRLPRPKR